MKAKQVIEYIFFNRKFALFCWFGLSLLAVLQASAENGLNNYFIFKGVFYHTLHSKNLYAPYPAEYGDINLYGPLFSLIIAPFALLPDKLGVILWTLANAGFLLFAFGKLPLPARWKTALLFLCCHELMISSAAIQVNPIVCGCIILGFAYTQKNKEGRALFFIMAAAFIKIYGIVGLAFFIFSKKRLLFITWAIIWSVVFFFAPLLITGFSFLSHSYYDWFQTLKLKYAKNISPGPDSLYQNVSVQGMIRRIFNWQGLNDLLVLVPAAILFLSQYLQHKYFRDLRFRLYILCSVLIATVIFSSGSESSTYIIAMPGLCIWYLLQRKSKWVNIFFVLAFLLTSFAYSDIFTPWARHHLFRPYSLKAIMPFIIWLIIIVQVYKKQFLKAILPVQNSEGVLFAV
jgi:hypothetical protein